MDAVADMPLAQRMDGRQQSIEAREAVDGSPKHDHQLLLLKREVGRKQPTQVGRNLEKPRVEEIGGGAGDRHDLGEARLNERDLLRCHGAGSKASALPADFPAGGNGCVCCTTIDTLRIIASIISCASAA